MGKKYCEPANLFLIVLCEAGTSKSQAFKMAVERPLESANLSRFLLGSDFTKAGIPPNFLRFFFFTSRSSLRGDSRS